VNVINNSDEEFLFHPPTITMAMAMMRMRMADGLYLPETLKAA